MDIVIEGWRVGASDWEAVRSLPEEQLPPLSAEQREVARKLGIPEVDYARSALAGQRNSQRLVEKAEKLGKLLQERLAANGRTATIHKIGLLTWDHRFDIDADIEGYRMTFRIAEEVVDDLFEGGSAEADQRLSRILELALAVRLV